MKGFAIALSGVVSSFAMVIAQEKLELAGEGTGFDMRINSREVLESVEPIREKLQTGSAAFYLEYDVVCYGLVVSEDGHIMTKASQLPDDEKLYVRIDRSRYGKPVVLATDEETDLALVKVDAKGLTLPEIDDSYPGLGSIIVSNAGSTRQERRARMGVISGMPREIEKVDSDLPYMGVAFDPPNKIKDVTKDGPAGIAGAADGDVIKEADGVLIDTIDDFLIALSEKKPGDILNLKVERGDKPVTLVIILGSRRQALGDEAMPKSRNDMMSGHVSKRRDGFPMVLEHDTPLSPMFMGGPLFDLHGKVRGLNIARANRAETFALPIKLVMETYEKLRMQADQQ